VREEPRAAAVERAPATSIPSPQTAAEPQSPAGEFAVAKSARERRYEELLRTPAPVEVPRAKPAEPAREIVPVVRQSTAAAPSAPPQPRRAATPPSFDAKGEPLEAGGDGAGQRQPENDSDVTPPLLLSAEFVPAQVEAGQQTVFIATVTDESEVRGVSGVIATPTGATIGFACRREGPAGGRFTTTIGVPEEAAAGDWVLRQLTLTDAITNTATLTRGTGQIPESAKFTVTSSSPDSAGPTLRNAWMERPAMRGGEQNTLFVDAVDEKAGVSMISGAFVSPSKYARIGFSCTRGEATTWQCPIAPPSCLDCGAWELEHLRIQDNARNVTNFRRDDRVVGAVQVEIGSDRCDATPPSIVAISFSPDVVSNAADSSVRVAVTINDEGCGFGSLSGQLMPPGNAGGQRTYITVDAAGGGPTYFGKITFRKQAAKGVWTINWLQVADKGLNLRAVPAAEPAVSRATVTVQ
jgi:limonene-1,2-epoxide hydrolase